MQFAPFAAFALASLFCFQPSWAFPQQTARTNTTETSSISGATPTCLPSCVPGRFLPYSVLWLEAQVVTTITAATVVLVVNNRTNATRTVTKFNTELGGYALPDTNSAGTKVTTVTQFDYLARTNITTVFTYPTTYYDYPYTFNWTGVVPSTTNGHATCVTNNGTAELLPSHPPVPVASPLPTHPPVNDDGRGLNYFAETLYDNCYGWRFLQKLFPDVGAVSGCASNVSTCVGPVHALATAEFLTQTSTSHEAVDNLQTSSTSLFPNPLPIAAPATSTLLFSSAASTSVPARPSQTVTASSTTLGVNIANSPTETSKATNPVPVVAGDTQTGPFVSSTHISSLSVAVTASPSSTKLIAETTNPSIASSSVIAGPAPIVIGSNTVIANSASEYIISGATLLPGAAITIGTGTSATVIALQTSNSENQIVIGSSTSLLAKPPPTEPSNGLPPFTIGTQTITANTLSQYIIDGQTLAPGSPLTLGTGPSATTVALQTSNSQIQLIIGTSTSILVGPSTPLPTSILGPGPITIGTQTLTPNSASEYLIASQTLVPGGPAITVSGTPVSLAPGATAVVVGTRTSGLGNYIWSGIGGGGPTTTNPGPATYTGGAEAVTSRRVWVLVFGVFCGVVVLL